MLKAEMGLSKCFQFIEGREINSKGCLRRKNVYEKTDLDKIIDAQTRDDLDRVLTGYAGQRRKIKRV